MAIFQLIQPVDEFYKWVRYIATFSTYHLADKSKHR
jgi:hypothetical protein